MNVRIIVYAGSSYVNGRWAAGDEPLYYVVSPKDIVIAKPRLVLRFSSFSVLNDATITTRTTTTKPIVDPTSLWVGIGRQI